MYLMYVDESGDPGIINSPTTHFIISSITLHEDSWTGLLNDLILFRRDMKKIYGLRMRDEIHAAEFFTRSNKYSHIQKHNRLIILKRCLDWLNNRKDISIITVCCNKDTKQDVFEFAWSALVQRFDNTLYHTNFPANPLRKDKDYGMLIADNTDGNKLTTLFRKMRRYNQVPNYKAQFGMGARNLTLRVLIEDPVYRDSRSSYIHQMVDVVAYFAKQHYQPNSYISKRNASQYYSRLENVINPHATKYKTFGGIVEL